jgi:serine/threonine-protein kinase
MNEEAELIFEQALELRADERPAFLAKACAGNPELLAELTSLLDQSNSAEKYFDSLQQSVLPSMATSAAIGRMINHYEILSHIGDGGMGTVYRALDTRLGREVALKFLPADANPQQEAARRLAREASAAAALQHPNICVIHDVGATDEGQPFIAMALCDGVTLKEKLRSGPLPVDEAIDIARQIARGLGAAHTRKIVHRDVKPANVMLGTDGIVRLLDFGLAKFMDAATTAPHGIRGTIAYMSPEQLRGDETDERADLWALGVMLYEMLAGARPFNGDRGQAVIESILRDQPEPLTSRNAEVPAGLSRIVDRLLQKKPDNRYARASEVLADLATVEQPHEPVSRKRKRMAGLYVIGTVAASALVLAGFLSRQQSRTVAADPQANQRRLTQNIAAYELYLRGRDPALFRSDSGPVRGLEYLDQAIALDSTFAAAYAAKTYFYWVLARLDDPDTTRKYRRLADSAAAKSIALDPSLPEAWLGLGFAKTIAMSNLEEAEAAVRRAIDLGGAPNAHEYLGKILLWRGNVDESMRESRMELESDPLSATASADLANTLCIAGRTDEGLAILDRLTTLEPPLRRIPGYRGNCYAMQGKWKEAIAAFRERQDTPSAEGMVGFALARSGDRASAIQLKRDLENRWAGRSSVALDIAMISGALGDRDDFFKWLNRSADELSMYGTIMLPFFKDMHADPRFAQFRQEHHF